MHETFCLKKINLTARRAKSTQPRAPGHAVQNWFHGASFTHTAHGGGRRFFANAQAKYMRTMTKTTIKMSWFCNSSLGPAGVGFLRVTRIVTNNRINLY
jgi:hypothetical protein